MFAVATIGRQAGHDVVAGLHRADIAAHLFDDTRRLVAEHDGRRMRIGTVDKVQVRVTNPDSDSTYQHLARARLADPHLFDGQRRARGVEYGSFHIIFLEWKRIGSIRRLSTALFQRLISEMIIWRAPSL
ncbi:hypothetical protein D3C81_1386100 [compost metagenome]